MKHQPILADYSLGEFSPKMYGRFDRPQYGQGAALFQNFKPQRQGGFTKRPGFLSLQQTNGNAAVANTYKFVVSTSPVTAFLLEFTNTTLRIFQYASNWAYAAPVATVTVPYLAADLPTLSFGFSYPYLFITHRNYQPAYLQYTNATTWTYAQFKMTGVTPFFLQANTHSNTTVDGIVGSGFSNSNSLYITGTTTSTSAVITAVASTTGLAAGYSITGPGIPYGTTVVSWTASTITMSAAATASATVAIAINQGIWVGMPVTASNIPAGTTVASVVSATSITISAAATSTLTAITVAISQQSAALPFQSAGNYPRCCTVSFQRVWFGSTTNQPLTLWATEVGYFDQNGWVGMGQSELVSYTVQQMNLNADGTPTTVTPTYTPTNTIKSVVGDADAIEITISSDYDDEITWLAASVDLIIGTASGEWVLPSSSTANNVAVSVISRTGGASVGGLMLNGGCVFVRTYGRGVSLLNWQGVANPFTPPVDMTFFSDHFFGNGVNVVEFDIGLNPEPVIYFLLSTGIIVACVFDMQGNVLAWHRLSMVSGHNIVSLCTIPTGTRDALVVAVTRGANTFLEMMDDYEWYDATQTNGNQSKSNYLDASFALNGAGASITVPTVFNGTSFTCVVDGAIVGTATANAGSVTLPVAATVAARIGPTSYIPTAKFQSMRIIPQEPTGSSMGKNRAIAQVNVMFLYTLNAKLGPDFNHLTSAALGAQKGTVVTNLAFPTMFSGIDPVQVDVDWNEDGYVCLQSDLPLPCTVLALVPDVEEGPP